MDRKHACVIETVGGYEGFNRLVERGRQMHNQAVFELLAGMMSTSFLGLKKCYGIAVSTRDSKLLSAGRSMRQSPPNPVQAVAEM